MNTLKARTISGFKWSSLEQVSIYGLRFILGIILARLLLPSDYGITGLIAVFLAVSGVFINSGFGVALIQKKSRTEVDFSTVFYFNIVISIICWLMLVFARFLIAEFFNEPLLIDITPIIGLNLIINAFGIIQRTRLTINLDFKSQAKANFIATFVSGIIGIILAYKGFGVWALVYQSVVRNFINTINLWLYEKWFPMLKFSKDSFKSLFSFGSKLMLSGLLNTLYQNIYRLMIGKFFSAADLGFFNRATQFKNLPSQNLTLIINRVSFPTLSLLQGDDKKLLSAFKKFLKMGLFLILPFMASMIILARPLIILSVKEHWLQSVPLLQLLCISGALYPIHALNLTILQVKGRSDLFLKLEIIKKVLTTISVLITFSISVKAMVIGSIITSLIGLFINTHYTKKILDYGFFKQMRDFSPLIFITIIMMAVILASNYYLESNVLKLIVGSFSGIVSYLGLASMLKFDEIKEIRSILKKK